MGDANPIFQHCHQNLVNLQAQVEAAELPPEDRAELEAEIKAQMADLETLGFVPPGQPMPDNLNHEAAAIASLGDSLLAAFNKISEMQAVIDQAGADHPGRGEAQHLVDNLWFILATFTAGERKASELIRDAMRRQAERN